MRCEICKKEYNSIISLTNHIARGHKIKTQDYYDRYILKNNEDKCKTCGCKNKFINFNLGYYKHCSIKCMENDPEIKNKIEQTNNEKYGGIGFASKELATKSIKTFNENNKTNISDFSKLSWTEKSRKKRKKTIKDNGKLSKAIKKVWKKRTKKDIETIVNNTKTTKKNRYGSENYNNINQSIETKFKKYGKANGFNKKKHIQLDNYIFDSKFEYECYMFLKNKNIQIEKSTKTIPYIFANKIHLYNPDFKIIYDNKIYYVEIKGLHFYLNHNNKERMINPYVKDVYTKSYYDDLMEAKNQCMIRNKIYIITTVKELNDFYTQLTNKEQEFPTITTSINL